MLRVILVALLFAVLMSFGMAALVMSGIYNIAADEPHTESVRDLLEKLRDSSIERRVGSVVVPDDLAGPERIGRGVGNYDAMCAQCHRSPGQSATELSIGLYPTPPNLAEHGPVDPATAFWIIKHGIKLTGMPAWGKVMDDRAIWDIVAFLQALPKLERDQYRMLVAASGGHRHGGGSAHDGGMHDGSMHDGAAGQQREPGSSSAGDGRAQPQPTEPADDDHGDHDHGDHDH